MNMRLNWFTIQLAILGVPEQNVSEIIQDFSEEFDMRPHLRNPQVSWDKNGQRVLIQIDVENLNSELATEETAEEMLEIAVAIVADFERLQVQILKVFPSK